jgi:FtsH-binding integral membrane protein
MEYAIGLILGLGVAAGAAMIGFDRERAFYPTVLMVIASYYVLFAVMGASTRTLALEIVVASVFFLAAVVGFKTSPWLLVAAIVGHGVFDFAHHWFIDNPGVPHWWPGFCLAFDVSFGAFLAARLMTHSIQTASHSQ